MCNRDMEEICFEDRIEKKINLDTLTSDIANAGQEEIDDGYFSSAKDFLESLGELVKIAQNKVWEIEEEIVDLEERNASEDWQFWESLNDDLRGEYTDYAKKLKAAFPEEWAEEYDR